MLCFLRGTQHAVFLERKQECCEKQEISCEDTSEIHIQWGGGGISLVFLYNPLRP